VNMHKSEAKYQFKKVSNSAEQLMRGIQKFKANHKNKQAIEAEAVNSLLNSIEYELTLIKESVERPFTSDS
jgi:hypothetical protein